MDKILAPIKAIRAKCLDCSAGQVLEVQLCPIKDCSLYPYRLGHNPNRKGRQLSEVQKQAMVDRLAKARAAKSSIK